MVRSGTLDASRRRSEVAEPAEPAMPSPRCVGGRLKIGGYRVRLPPGSSLVAREFVWDPGASVGDGLLAGADGTRTGGARAETRSPQARAPRRAGRARQRSAKREAKKSLPPPRLEDPLDKRSRLCPRRGS
jgi:hypothetical protein